MTFFIITIVAIITLLILGNICNPAVQSVANELKSTNLPVIMYHIILEDSNKINDYIITPTQLEEDLIYLKENGYNTITTTQLLDFVNLGEPLPENPIIITFDDGYETIYHYALPLLKKYNMTAISSVLGIQVDYYSENYNENQMSYSHSTWEQLKIMQESGIFELGNHTYDMHKPEGSSRFGTLINYNESESEYQEELKSDISNLNLKFQQNLEFIPNIFAYPYGKISKESISVIEDMGFDIILTCEEKVNIISQGEQSPIYLKRYNRSGYYKTSDFFAKFV